MTLVGRAASCSSENVEESVLHALERHPTGRIPQSTLLLSTKASCHVEGEKGKSLKGAFENENHENEP